MAINFPSGLDALTNPQTTDPQNNPSHAGQHTDANDILEALEAKVGIDSSAVATSHDYILANDVAKLAGQSGGQTLIGGTDASDDLTLQSTSNATKGKILFAEVEGNIVTMITTTDAKLGIIDLKLSAASKVLKDL